MHKSTVLTFGLLMSSLVMLSAMPLFFNNNNRVAMAQGYDNNYGYSYYSQYPTDDKKYECRTGPFEGFFVSSVEFCKHVKFDDNKKDRDSNRTGPQGPEGFTELNDTNLYGVTGNVTVTGPLLAPVATSTALCDEGDIVVEGGYRANALAPYIVATDGPLPLPQGPPIPPPIVDLDSGYEVSIR